MTAITDITGLHHATRKKAERLMSMFEAEYPALSLDWTLNEDASKVVEWTVNHEQADEPVVSGPKVPDLSDVIEACEDQGLDPEEGADDEEDRSGSIVPDHYRREYAARGDENNCGDFLAKFCKDQCHMIPEGKSKGHFSVDDFVELLRLNDVQMEGTKWAKAAETRSPGWQGRFRMSGRIALEKIVAMRGYVVSLAGDRVALDPEDLDALRAKHPKLPYCEAEGE